MKLYVWENVLTDYTSGIMFALANSVEEARGLILAKGDYPQVFEDLDPEPKVYDTPVGYQIWGGG